MLRINPEHHPSLSFSDLKVDVQSELQSFKRAWFNSAIADFEGANWLSSWLNRDAADVLVRSAPDAAELQRLLALREVEGRRL